MKTSCWWTKPMGRAPFRDNTSKTATNQGKHLGFPSAVASGWRCALNESEEIHLKTGPGQHGGLLCTRLPLGAPPNERKWLPTSCPSAFPGHRHRFHLLRLDSLQKVLCEVDFAVLTNSCVHTVTQNPACPTLGGETKVTEPHWAEAHSFCLTLNVLEQMVFENL